MKLLSTRTHGMMDYIMGVVLIIAPWLLQFAQGGAETWVPVVLGASMIFYSLMTNYEVGAARVISMPTHLWMDGVGGLFLALSPWLFGFAEIVFLPHLILGILEIGAAMMTDPTPSTTFKRKPAL